MDELTLLRDFRLEDAAADGAREHARMLLRDSVRRSRRRRRLAVAAVALGLALLGTAAYGIARALRVGEPAPPEVRAQLVRAGHEAELIRVPHSPELRGQDATVAATLDSSAGRVDLFAVPTTSAELCGWTWVERKRTAEGAPDMSSVCGLPGKESFYSFAHEEVDGRMLRLVQGHAAAGVARVSLRLGDREVDVPLVGRWFLAELATDPSAFTSYDAAGRVLERREFPRRLPGSRPYPVEHRVGRERTVLTIRSRDTGRTIRLSLARSSTGGTCVYVRAGKDVAGGCGPYPGGKIRVSPMALGGASGGTLLLVGPVAPDVRRLELRYEDGRRARMPIREGHTLYDVVRADYRAGRRPEVVVGRDSSGRIVAEQRLRWLPGAAR